MNSNLSFLYQYDFATRFNSSNGLYSGVFLQTISITNPGQNLHISQIGSNLVVYRAYKPPFLMTYIDQIRLFKVSMNYTTSAISNCQPTYTKNTNGIQCFKSSFLFQNNHFPQIISLNISNISNSSNFSSSSNTSNSSNFLNFNNSLNPQNNQNDLISLLNQSYALNKTLSVIARIMTFTSYRISPQFFTSFVDLLDDLWFYNFHRTTYPKQALFFMQRVNVMNQIRYLIKKRSSNLTDQSNENISKVQVFYGLFNDYGDDGYQIDKFSAFYFNRVHNRVYQNYLYQFIFQEQISQNIGNKNVETIFFYNSNQQFLTNILLFNICYFLIFKILQKMFKMFKRIFKLVQNAYQFISTQTKWWTLIVALIQINIAPFTFACFMQIIIPSFFQFCEKINIVITYITLFTVITYSFCFYIIIFELEKKRNAQKMKKILSKQKSQQKQQQSKLKQKLQANDVKQLENKKMQRQQQSFKFSLFFFGYSSINSFHQLNQISNIQSKNLLRRTSANIYLIQPYIYESTNFILRNFVRSFIHAYFISNYNTQITLLFLIDLLSLIIAAKNEHLYKSKCSFYLAFIYYVSLTFFDLYFVVEQLYSQNGLTKEFLRSIQPNFCLFTLGILVASTIFQCFIALIICIIEIITSLKFYIQSFEEKKLNNPHNQLYPFSNNLPLYKQNLQVKQSNENIQYEQVSDILKYAAAKQREKVNSRILMSKTSQLKQKNTYLNNKQSRLQILNNKIFPQRLLTKIKVNKKLPLKNSI